MRISEIRLEGCIARIPTPITSQMPIVIRTRVAVVVLCRSFWPIHRCSCSCSPSFLFRFSIHIDMGGIPGTLSLPGKVRLSLGRDPFRELFEGIVVYLGFSPFVCAGLL